MDIIFDSISPYSYKKLENPLEIIYGFHPTPFGKCLIAIIDDKICYLSFVDNTEQEALQVLQKEWNLSPLTRNQDATHKIVYTIFSSTPNASQRKFQILVKGSPFQINVWKILINLPKDTTISYQEVAKKMGDIKATRAVARAIASNSIAYLIPCHLIIRKSGQINKYRWGVQFKKALLDNLMKSF